MVTIQRLKYALKLRNISISFECFRAYAREPATLKAAMTIARNIQKVTKASQIALIAFIVSAFKAE